MKRRSLMSGMFASVQAGASAVGVAQAQPRGDVTEGNQAAPDAERVPLAAPVGTDAYAFACVQELYPLQVESAQHLDELRAQATIVERQLRMAVQAREATQLELQRSAAALHQWEIRSPIDGLVTERLISAGEYVHQEAVILRLAKLDPLYVEAYLPVRLYPMVHTGMTAMVERSRRRHDRGTNHRGGPDVRCRQRHIWRAAGRAQCGWAFARG